MLTLDALITVINVGDNQHWMCAELDVPSRVIRFYDSLSVSNGACTLATALLIGMFC